MGRHTPLICQYTKSLLFKRFTISAYYFLLHFAIPSIDEMMDIVDLAIDNIFALSRWVSTRSILPPRTIYFTVISVSFICLHQSLPKESAALPLPLFTYFYFIRILFISLIVLSFITPVRVTLYFSSPRFGHV